MQIILQSPSQEGLCFKIKPRRMQIRELWAI